MTHRSRLFVAVIDVPAGDHAEETSFWGAATGRPMRELDSPEFHGARLGDHFALIVQRLGVIAATERFLRGPMRMSIAQLAPEARPHERRALEPLTGIARHPRMLAVARTGR